MSRNDYGLKCLREAKQELQINEVDGRTGMTRAGDVAALQKQNEFPGSKLKTAVHWQSQGPGSKAAYRRRKSFCARSAGQMKTVSVKLRRDPNSRSKTGCVERWKC